MAWLEALFFAAAPTVLLLAVLYGLRRELRDNWKALAFLGVACLAFFHRIVFLSEAISQSDANLLQMQFFRVYREAVSAGCIPFWNHLQGTGLPNLAHPLSAMFYPMTPLFLLTDVYKAMSLFVVGHYFLAGLFALLLGRRLFRTRHAALAFAILYAFNGWAMTRAAHQPAIEYMFAYTWLPLVALCIERALAGRGTGTAFAGAAVGLAWMGTTCPNFFVWGGGFLALALVMRLVWLLKNGRPFAAVMTFSFVLAVCFAAGALAAVELIPAIELSYASTLGRFGKAFPTGWRGAPIALTRVLALFVPYVKERPFAVFYSPGLLALPAALLGAYAGIRAKAHRGLVVGCIILLVTGVLLLTQTRYQVWLGQLLPIVARSSLIPAALVFLFLPVVTLAGAGVERIVEGRRWLLGRWGYVPALLILLELFMIFGVLYPRVGQRRLTYDYRREVADFPHLDALLEEKHIGRIVTYPPREQTVLAPSYATGERGISRLNLHASAFAPNWVALTIERTARELVPEKLEVLGVGWVVATERIGAQTPEIETPWPSVIDHFENSLFWPMRNLPGWLAWDQTVRLYRVTDEPVLARADYSPEEGPTNFAQMTLFEFDSWQPLDVSWSSPNTYSVELQETPKRVFFAVTAYPGWRLAADGKDVDWSMTANGLMAATLSAEAASVELSFVPRMWGFYLATSVIAFVWIMLALIFEKVSSKACSPQRQSA